MSNKESAYSVELFASLGFKVILMLDWLLIVFVFMNVERLFYITKPVKEAEL
jgi:hypothetical protein